MQYDKVSEMAHLAGEDGADAQAVVPHGRAGLAVAGQAGVLQDVCAPLHPPQHKLTLLLPPSISQSQYFMPHPLFVLSSRHAMLETRPEHGVSHRELLR